MKKWIVELYFIIFLLFVLLTYVFIDQNLVFLKALYTGIAFSHRLSVSIFYGILVFLLFALYLLGLREVGSKKPPVSFFKKPLGILVILGFFSYPAMLSYDIFNYMLTSRVLYFYHENPYIIMPTAFLGDPYLLFTHAANKTALYGLSWILLTSIPYFLGFGNFILTLFAFKTVNILFYLGTIWLIYQLSKNALSVFFFAFNPLVVIETLVSNHNDIVMMFFALLCFYFLFQKKIVLAFIVLLVSIFVKFATIFLIPVVCYLVWKKLRNKRFDEKRMYLFAGLSMFVIFLLSPIRAEIYPWYAIWFLVFASFLVKKKLIMIFAIPLSFGLMLRYIPFMYLGTYFGPTPSTKTLVTFVPVVISVLYYFFVTIKIKKGVKKKS